MFLGPWNASSLPSIANVVSYSNYFGSPSSWNDPRLRMAFLGTSIEVVQNSQALVSSNAGIVLFSQSIPKLSGGLPLALGRALALRYDDGTVALLSGLDSESTGPGHGRFNSGDTVASLGMGKAGAFGFSLRLFDQDKAAWVNPLLMLQLPHDSVSPRIESIILRRAKASIELALPPKGRGALSQGMYTIFIRAVEPGGSSYSSGVFRYKVLLDGQVVQDKSLDSALDGGNGLSFMGLAPPSFSAIDDKGRLGLGNLDLPRGQHLLEIFVFDFAGNPAQGAWRLMVE